VPWVVEAEIRLENPKVYADYPAFLADWQRLARRPRRADRSSRLARMRLVIEGHDGIVIEGSTTDVLFPITTRRDFAVFDPDRIRVVRWWRPADLEEKIASGSAGRATDLIGSAGRTLTKEERFVFDMGRKRAARRLAEGDPRSARLQWAVARSEYRKVQQHRANRAFQQYHGVYAGPEQTRRLVAAALQEPWLYHFTTWPTLARIRREGLCPRPMDEDRKEREAVYLTSEAGFDKWASWAHEKWAQERPEAWGGSVVLLRVPTGRLDPARVQPDFVGTSDSRFFVTSRPRNEGALAVRYMGTIPPEDLEWVRARRVHHPAEKHRDIWSDVEVQGPWLKLRG
jgi:hypothetical protein